MRTDPRTSPGLARAPSTARPATAWVRPRWVTAAVLVPLMAATSWAVASWLSPWLVPLYLILMALLLSPASGGTRPAESGQPRATRSPEGLDEVGDLSGSPASASPTEGGPEQAPSSQPSRARRGKAKAKKARPLLEPTEASWVQVAPGKFVRVEASDESTGPAGPHAPLGDPAGPPEDAPPPEPAGLDPEGDRGLPLDDSPTGDDSKGEPGPPFEGSTPGGGPIEDDGPGPFDPLEGPGSPPTGEFESGSPTDRGKDESPGSPWPFAEAPAVDGNAPQAGGPVEGTEAGWSTAPPETIEDRPRDGLESPNAQEEGDPSPAFEAFDPTVAVGGTLADVLPEEEDDGEEADEWADPTETAVDETVLDDAGPLEASCPGAEPSEDADSLATGTPPVPPRGPTSRPWRPSSGSTNRVGISPRGGDCRAPSRRPVRSPGPPRRPPTPRRLGPRGLGRPRQIDRTFPPRSPPGQGCRPGRIGRPPGDRPCGGRERST